MPYSDVYGHKKQIDILKKSQLQHRVGHAYLFSGISGVGKRTLAWEFAKALNCENFSDNADACGRCSSCTKIEHGNHPDITQIEADGQYIRINTVREIQEQMKFRPLAARRRVFIIDDADRMNEQSANSILKTLEEPSVYNVLILITARPHALPLTILSRCRQMIFNPLPVAQLAGFLADQSGMEKTRAALLAGIAGGSIGRALDRNQDDIIELREGILKILTPTDSGNPLSRVRLASFLGQDKKEIHRALEVLSTLFRDAVVLKETKRQDMLINQDSLPVIAGLAERLSGEQYIRNITLLEKAGRAIDLNANKSLTLEVMAFKLNL